MRILLPRSITIPLSLVVPLSGCANPTPRPAVRQDTGVILILPGIEGNEWPLRRMVEALYEAGVDRRIDIIPWGVGSFQSLDNLINHPKNLERARQRAERIIAEKRDHPGAPVTLIGYSGGGGLAILTLEALPEGVVVDHVILLAAALAPEHEMTVAFSRCGHFTNFYSPRDTTILGLGTRMFGTIDRQRTASAGLKGLLAPDGGLLRHPKLTQISWTADWNDLGHDGGHVGWLARPWAREVLARQIDPPGTVQALRSASVPR